MQMMATMEAGKYLPFCVRASDGEYIEDLEEELMTAGSAKERAEYPSEEECVEIRDFKAQCSMRLIIQKMPVVRLAPSS